MKNRMIAWVAIPALLLIVATLAWAAAAPPDPTVIPVEDAGNVVISQTESQLEIVAAIANVGYRSEVLRASGRAVEAIFIGGENQVFFRATRVGADLRVAVEVRGPTGEELLAAALASLNHREPSSTPPAVVNLQPSPTTTAPPATTTVTRPSTTTTTLAPSTTTTAPPTTTTTAPPTTTTLADPRIADGAVTYPLGPAGKITILFLAGEIVEASIDFSKGWNAEKFDIDSDRVEVELEGDDLRVVWEARIVNGEVVVDLSVFEDD